jgi:hypothetical protein
MAQLPRSIGAIKYGEISRRSFLPAMKETARLLCIISVASSFIHVTSGSRDERSHHRIALQLDSKGRSPDRSPASSTEEKQLANCRSLFEWVDFIGEIDGKVYTGVSQVGLIGSSSTPVFDNPGLLGNPIANLRGSGIVDERDMFVTGTPSFYFYDDSGSILTFFLGFSAAESDSGPEGNYGIPLGGTGEWSGYAGFIYNSRLTSRYESPYIVNYTMCSAQR